MRFGDDALSQSPDDFGFCFAVQRISECGNCADRRLKLMAQIRDKIGLHGINSRFLCDVFNRHDCTLMIHLLTTNLEKPSRASNGLKNSFARLRRFDLFEHFINCLIDQDIDIPHTRHRCGCIISQSTIKFRVNYHDADRQKI